MTEVLRDVLAPEMRVVFCGTAPGTASAKAQAYYAGPGNAFWQALHLTGLTPVELVPAEFERLPEFGIGLTDICKVAYGSDAEVGTVEFDVGGLQEKIAAAEPGCLAFNGKNAARGALERDVALRPPGRARSAAPPVWVLPSTSGRARRFWKHRALAGAGPGLRRRPRPALRKL